MSTLLAPKCVRAAQVAGAQQPPAAHPVVIRDESKVWETIAAAQYKLDGNDVGWDSDVSDEETPDDKYIRVGAATQPTSRIFQPVC